MISCSLLGCQMLKKSYTHKSTVVSYAVVSYAAIADTNVLLKLIVIIITNILFLLFTIMSLVAGMFTHAKRTKTKRLALILSGCDAKRDSHNLFSFHLF